ncbi:MAG: histidine--tRNA ligase [Trueperaceae bacterium]|nr:MAG: histidine--tRNA ligase [Trueperaceae bacterium]
MAKITPISGFPEWLPEQRLIEQQVLDTVRRQFELYGFAPIETRAIEPLDVLLSKGDDKEIYVLQRLHAEDHAEAEFGLHFDITIPFARYVQQHRGQLHFPFKRYQIQKVWRGERPQEGRYREFYQADIDVIGDGELPLAYDAEFPRLIHEIVDKLPIPPLTIGVNNRKLLEGFYRGLGIEDITGTLRIMDKLGKIGVEGVLQQLTDQLGLEPDQAQNCVALGQIRGEDSSFTEEVRALGIEHELLSEGLSELAFVMEACEDLPPGRVGADLSIARGLDYYTGTVYECYLEGHEQVGSVCGGGRYDNLASDAKVKLPGVGISLGVTRILGYLFGRGLLSADRSTPVVVLVALPDEESRLAAMDVARRLRRRGIPADVHHSPQKYGKQIRAAERRGIPYVWFFDPKGEDGHQVRDIRGGQQVPADPDAWTPSEEDFFAG